MCIVEISLLEGWREWQRRCVFCQYNLLIVGLPGIPSIDWGGGHRQGEKRLNKTGWNDTPVGEGPVRDTDSGPCTVVGFIADGWYQMTKRIQSMRARSLPRRLPSKYRHLQQVPFVQLSTAYHGYPLIRRTSQLSYTVWLLIIAASISGGFDEEEYLNTMSISDQLRKTALYLDLINNAIKQMIG